MLHMLMFLPVSELLVVKPANKRHDGRHRLYVYVVIVTRMTRDVMNDATARGLISAAGVRWLAGYVYD